MYLHGLIKIKGLNNVRIRQRFCFNNHCGKHFSFSFKFFTLLIISKKKKTTTTTTTTTTTIQKKAIASCLDSDVDFYVTSTFFFLSKQRIFKWVPRHFSTNKQNLPIMWTPVINYYTVVTRVAILK